MSNIEQAQSEYIGIPIPGWPEYTISQHGEIKRVKASTGAVVGKSLKWTVTNAGYAKVSLCKNSVRKEYLVHRLVALTYIGDQSGMDVCHFDGVKLNNTLANLRIDSRKGNMRDQIRMGKTPRGEKSGSNKYPESMIKEIKQRISSGSSVSDLHRQTGIPIPTLYGIRSGVNWGWL